MAWTKSPQGLIELFDACLPSGPGIERRQMFGYPAAFVNGNLFGGLFQDVAFVRLPPAAREALERDFGARHFEPMPGRPMRAYVALPDEVLEDEGRFAQLLHQAYAFASGLPPKPKKAAPAKG